MEAYPLQWPPGRARTVAHRRQRSRFETTFTRAVREVVDELRRLGAKNQVVSSNIPLRRDGMPLASARNVDDPGIAVYFRYKERQMVFACDRWDNAEDNLWAVAKTIAAMRGISRWGSGDMMDSAFSGFTQLAAPRYDWRAVLHQTYGDGLDVAEDAYRQLARINHPDVGGTEDKMSELNAAIAAAREELKEIFGT